MAKKKAVLFLVCVITALAMWSFASVAQPAKETGKTKLCVGTFNSRAVAIAHFGEVVREGQIEKLYTEGRKAQAAGDMKKFEEVSAKANAIQERFHMQVFGSAPINNILEKIKKDIPKIAQLAGVDIVVCEYDVIYQNPSAQLVDITGRMVELFDPDEETLGKIEAVLEHPPVPIEKLKDMKCEPPSGDK